MNLKNKVSKGFDEKIDSYKTISWRTIRQKNVEQFRRLIKSKQGNELFDLKYIEKISLRVEKAAAISFKLLITYAIIIFILYASQNDSKLVIKVMSLFSIEVVKYQTYILLFSSFIFLYSTVKASQRRHLESIIEAWVKEKAKGECKEYYYKHMWLSYPYDSLIKNNQVADNKFNHPFILFLTAITCLLSFLAMIVIYLFFIYLQFDVISHAFTNPTGGNWVNTVLLSITSIFILTSIIIDLSSIPLPEMNYENTDKLLLIKNKNPEKFSKLTSEIHRKANEKNESRLTYFYITSVVISAYLFSVCHYRINLSDLFESYTTLFLTLLLSTYFCQSAWGAVTTFTLKRLVLKNYAQRSEEANLKRFEYSNNLRIIICFLVSIFTGFIISTSLAI